MTLDVFFNDTATTEIYTLSLHDALPISARGTPVSVSLAARAARLPAPLSAVVLRGRVATEADVAQPPGPDWKSTHLNSRHTCISYCGFFLKKNDIDQNSPVHGHTYPTRS